MCLVEPVGVASDGMTFPKECDVRSRSVFGDSVCCDSEVDYFVCEVPNAWCHDMPEIRGDSVYEYVNYVGHSPDCVDRTVLDDVDGYPEGMLHSELVCIVTDDMPYQGKIEALSGTIYDYDDVCDNLPDYDEPYDCEELCGFDGSVECGMCYDTCESDVSGGSNSVQWCCVRTGTK